MIGHERFRLVRPVRAVSSGSSAPFVSERSARFERFIRSVRFLRFVTDSRQAPFLAIVCSDAYLKLMQGRSAPQAAVCRQMP